jgi:hypothetical protein
VSNAMAEAEKAITALSAINVECERLRVALDKNPREALASAAIAHRLAENAASALFSLTRSLSIQAAGCDS